MVDEITVETLEEWKYERDPFIIDIRAPEKFEAGHIQKSKNIPMNELVQQIDTREWEEPIVVVCDVGEASRQAARLLASHEAIDADTVWNLSGGYRAWKQHRE
ncbi:rhodanese-like domain-containing protein [Salinarchaeum sp. IM2453]|uniref:rhodanese-like domain-containing protein n=1 Tax=Salinarchaeum sp. IM2453 TaxID=2862870 RepID=UPI001C835096|nr:rhodanese-like domain-containing protein [Salinarchaeum sp. IM2453]QZA88883.1 rhodanese-like domain-containing protein [Salinarchaeum sp. IM2453]